jgi:hypothetical protein
VKRIVTQLSGGRYSCSPADPEDDDGDEWDRARDRWIDEQEEVL